MARFQQPDDFRQATQFSYAVIYAVTVCGVCVHNRTVGFRKTDSIILGRPEKRGVHAVFSHAGVARYFSFWGCGCIVGAVIHHNLS